ncbi:hypothetical protein KXR53_20450 [Inquilinus limosus]|uniref:hypothetical protein n=1 Tax=Inquilinus limosus TaxID=171674 RepID=UPI003F17FF88
MEETMRESNIATGQRFQLNWQAAIAAGIIAGIVFLVVEMGLVALTGGEIWGPPRMMAAIAMGEGALPPPATFSFGIVMVAMIVHFVLSIVYGFILGLIIGARSMSTGIAALVGLAFGLALYLINFYGFAAVAFPWFAMARNWMSILAHLVFGGVLGWSYKAIAERTRRPA